MRKSKLILLIISSFIMAMLISATAFAESLSRTKIVVKDTATTVGETVEVPIDISENMGICGATINISYDNKLKLKGVAAGDALASLTMTRPGNLNANPIRVLWDGVEPDDSNGKLLSLSFEAPDIAGEYEVSISYETGDIMDGNLDPVDVEVQSGKVIVTDDVYDCKTQGHKGGEATCVNKAICEICKMAYGDYDLSKHIGHVYTIDKKSATCMDSGYTGDKYCDACNGIIEKGVVEEKIEHLFLNYISDGNATTKRDGTKTALCEYGCGTKDTIVDEGSKLEDICEKNGHKGGVATCVARARCEVCNSEYGEVDPDNHRGDTIIKGYIEPTCLRDGYEGDTYCCDCDTVIATGTVIPAKGHLYTNYIDDENEVGIRTASCEYGCGATDSISADYDCEESGHRGGKATCIESALCALCGDSYGEVDTSNHIGDTIIKDQMAAKCEKNGYTGDIYCSTCDNLIRLGHMVKPIGHSFTNYVSDKNATVEQAGTKTALCDNGCGKTNTIDDFGVLIKYHITDKIVTEDITYMGSHIIKPDDPVRVGYKFVGWYEDLSGTTLWNFDEAIVDESDKNIYAKWELIEYNITYDLNGGELSEENPNNITVETETFTLNNPIREGYTFVGWTDNNDENTQPMLTVIVQKGTANDLSFTANWKPINNDCYDIYMSVEGKGSVITNTQTEFPGAIVSITVTPDKGYELHSISSKQVTFVEIDSGKYVFVMPANDVDIEVVFSLIDKVYLEQVIDNEDSTYIVNIATREKTIINDLFKAKEESANYKIIADGKSKSIASLNRSGIIQGKKVGVANYTVNKNGNIFNITINVYNPQFKYEVPKNMFFVTNVGEEINPDYDNCNLKPVFSIDSKSERNGIATIDPETGKLTALKKGTVTVTATVGGEQNKKYARKVTTKVKIFDPTFADFKIGKKGEINQLPIGKTLPLKIKNGYGNTTWSVADDSVATIDNKNRLKAVGFGKTTVTAINNGRVIEKEIVVPLPEITSAKDTVAVNKTLALKLKNGIARPKTVWSVSDEKIATITQGGVLKGVAPGKVTVIAENSGVKVEKVITVE